MFRFTLCQLSTLRSYDMYNQSGELVPFLLARLYFQLPQVQKQILSTVLTDSEREEYIGEWRGVGFMLDAEYLRK